MKKIAVLITSISLLLSCSSGPKPAEPNYLPPIKAEIPSELNDNQDIVDYINTTTDVLNDVSRELEDLYVKIEPYADIPESEISTMDKLRISKYAIQFTAEMAKLGAKMATMKETYHMMSDDLSDDEQQALEVINETFLKRIKQLNDKYKDLDNFDIEISEENNNDVDSVQE
jgi:hypothetical protein